jgi:metal-responsive CopG/Arc/MetJ family transcriptional regulator
MEVYKIMGVQMLDGRLMRLGVVIVDCDPEEESIDLEFYTLYHDDEPAIEVTYHVSVDMTYKLSMLTLKQIEADIADDQYSKFISQH